MPESSVSLYCTQVLRRGFVYRVASSLPVRNLFRPVHRMWHSGASLVYLQRLHSVVGSIRREQAHTSKPHDVSSKMEPGIPKKNRPWVPFLVSPGGLFVLITCTARHRALRICDHWQSRGGAMRMTASIILKTRIFVVASIKLQRVSRRVIKSTSGRLLNSLLVNYTRAPNKRPAKRDVGKIFNASRVQLSCCLTKSTASIPWISDNLYRLHSLYWQ